MRSHTTTPAALTAAKVKAKEQEKKTAKMTSSPAKPDPSKGGKKNG